MTKARSTTVRITIEDKNRLEEMARQTHRGLLHMVAFLIDRYEAELRHSRRSDKQ